MTAYELMDTNQNETIKESKTHPSIKLPKFLSSTPALNTPPPESLDFYHEISLSDISLNRLEHIVEDTGFQEDTALTPLLHTPPQSAGFSQERKNFHKLNSEFSSKHSLFKLNLKRSFSRLNRLRQNYLSEKSAKSNELAYELEKNKLESDNELTDDEAEFHDDSFWSSTRLRIGSEWSRCRQKISLIETRKNSLSQSKSTSLVNIKNQLKNVSTKNTKAIEYFRTNVIKSNCTCDPIISKQEMCIFCSMERMSKPNKGLKRTLDDIYFDHSYTKLPTLHSSNEAVNDLDILNCMDDDALNKIVNDRLDKIFNSVDYFLQKDQDLPNLTSEELMEYFEDSFESGSVDVENMRPMKSTKKIKSYNETKLKEFRYGAKKTTFGQKQVVKECAKAKRVARSRSSSASVLNDEAQFISSNTNKYDINNILIPNELISNQKIACIPAHKITTPSWRIVDIDPLCDGPKPDEELSDTSYLDRHKIIEMKEKINFSNLKNSFDSNLKDYESTLFSNETNKKLEWPERKFPLSDQDYKLMVDES